MEKSPREILCQLFLQKKEAAQMLDILVKNKESIKIKNFQAQLELLQMNIHSLNANIEETAILINVKAQSKPFNK